MLGKNIITWHLSRKIILAIVISVLALKTIAFISLFIVSFFLATKSNEFEWVTLLYVVLCMIFARSAAMAFNRYIDRHIDAANSRTAQIREIPNGLR